MGDVSKLINWFRARQGKVTYSMPNRYGPNSYDCSSAVFNALIEAGFLPAGTFPGNTENLYKLEGSLLQPITRNEVRAGDIFVAGPKGASYGGFGHTGVAVSNTRIIHCNYNDNGISETPISGRTGSPCYWYRLKGTGSSGSNENNTQKSTLPTIKEDEIMFLYWKQNKDNKKQFDAFFVNGNTRMHIPNDTLLKECRDLVKRYKGVTEETRYSHDNWGVAAIEKTTNLVKW